jgi:hypothetical protein
MDIDALSLTKSTRQVLAANPAALALYEYATLTNEAGEQVSEKLAKAIELAPETIEYRSVFKKIFYEVGYTDYRLNCTTAVGEWHSDSEIKIDKLGYIILNGTKTKDFWDGTIKSDKPPLRIKNRNICGDETVSVIAHS